MGRMYGIDLESHLFNESYIKVNAFDTYELLKLTDPNGKTIFQFSDSRYAPDDLTESPYIKDIVETGMCRSHGNGGCNPVKDPYVNITQILAEHFATKLSYSVDQKERLIIIDAEKVQ